MKRRKILKTIFILLICISGFSQNICGEIDYTYKVNIDYLYIEHYTMFFNNDISYSEEIKIKTPEGRVEKEFSDEGLTVNHFAERKNTVPQFFYNTRKAFYFSQNWEDSLLLVKENPFNWNWKLHNETKQLGKFLCQKATIRFRGRDYTAWFTNEIPVPFGPWKFQGLSGVILEVYDTTKEFHITANKIRMKKSNCAIEFDTSQLKDALTISQYIEKKRELLELVFAKMSSKLPKGSAPMVIDWDCEDCGGKGIETFNE